MRTLFAVPWFSKSGKRLLISLATALLLVSGVFALLKWRKTRIARACDRLYSAVAGRT